MEQAKKDILTGFIFLVLEFFLLYYLWKNNILLMALLLVVSAIALIAFCSREERVLYFVCFVLTPIFDLTLVPRNVWTYGNPTIYGVPIWIPFAYGLGTVMLVKIGRAIAKLYFKN